MGHQGQGSPVYGILYPLFDALVPSLPYESCLCSVRSLTIVATITFSRALAQKISIRMRKKFNLTKLVEINCQSLFSKWFGGSGHLVGSLFSAIETLVSENERCFVCIFIDEIESLTSTRQSAVSGNEPLDSMRVRDVPLNILPSNETNSHI
jgi:hypothetical protein